jgi:hypothetical protein
LPGCWYAGLQRQPAVGHQLCGAGYILPLLMLVSAADCD